MPDEHRVTIRLSPELYAQLAVLGSHGQPLAVVVRQALADYLARQPAQASGADEAALTLAAMAASLAELRAQMQDLAARVDALAAICQPLAARDRQPQADTAAKAWLPPRRHRGDRQHPAYRLRPCRRISSALPRPASSTSGSPWATSRSSSTTATSTVPAIGRRATRSPSTVARWPAGWRRQACTRGSD
jgi:predicted transcriptional regulator